MKIDDKSGKTLLLQFMRAKKFSRRELTLNEITLHEDTECDMESVCVCVYVYAHIVSLLFTFECLQS